MDRNKEVQNLNEADRHISKAERAVSQQIAIVAKLERDGHDSSLAVKELRHFEKALEVMRKHRENIVKTIEKIDAGRI